MLRKKRLTFVQWLKERDACSDAIKWVERDCRGRLDIAWKKCNRPGWMVWLIKEAQFHGLRGWSARRLKRVRYSKEYYRGNTFPLFAEGRREKLIADQLRKLFTPPRWNGAQQQTQIAIDMLDLAHHWLMNLIQTNDKDRHKWVLENRPDGADLVGFHSLLSAHQLDGGEGNA